MARTTITVADAVRLLHGADLELLHHVAVRFRKANAELMKWRGEHMRSGGRRALKKTTRAHAEAEHFSKAFKEERERIYELHLGDKDPDLVDGEGFGVTLYYEPVTRSWETFRDWDDVE